MAQRIIDFAQIEGPVYTGRDRGELLRTNLQLDQYDAVQDDVVVRIPDETYSISSSFFLGLFGPSVVRYGSREAFYNKYKFTATEFIRGILDGHVARALQDKNLFAPK
jgi:hypothetical protein